MTRSKCGLERELAPARDYLLRFVVLRDRLLRIVCVNREAKRCERMRRGVRAKKISLDVMLGDR
jgi:hypothetical protein